MSYEPLNRRLALLSAIFAFLGVLLGAIALGTNYWTIKPTVEPIYNGTTRLAEGESVRRWNGLFWICQNNDACYYLFRPVTFVIGVLGLLFLLVGGIFAALGMPRATDRRFVTPLLIFTACVLMTAALVDYAAYQLLNSHSSRTMIAAVVFAYAALPLAAFVAGRQSALERSAFLTNGVPLTTQKYSATNGHGH